MFFNCSINNGKKENLCKNGNKKEEIKNKECNDHNVNRGNTGLKSKCKEQKGGIYFLSKETILISVLIAIFALFAYLFIPYIKYFYDYYDEISFLKMLCNKICMHSCDNKKFIPISDINSNIPKKNDIIIGVDFGSTQSGYQIFYNSEIIFEEDKIFPTFIIMEGHYKKGLFVGENTGKDYLPKFPYERLEKENKILFTKFKRNLDPKNQCNIANSTIPIDGQMENDIVIVEFLRLIKEYIIKNSHNGLINYENIKDVKWVLTVPPLWDDRAKKKMKEFAIRAEMYNAQIALEPEVDSLAIFYDEKIKKESLKPGSSFLIVDMGGYTIDFTAMKILDKDKNLEQLLKPISFTFGSNLINDYIISIIEEVYKKDRLEKVKITNYSLWEKTLEEIEDMKLNLDKNEAENVKIGINFVKGNCRLLSNKCTLKYKDVDINYSSEYIIIPKKLVIDKINELADKIVNEINKILANTIEINDLIILTGGFSNNKILRDKIDSGLKKNIRKKIYLDNPEKTVMKGAALFGIKPNQIIRRIMPVTIGISIDDNNFFTFVHRGESVETDKIIKKQIIPLENRIQIYYSDKKEDINENNKIYLDDINISFLDISNKYVTISMKFSSIITVKVTEKESDFFEEKILYYPS